MKYRRTVEQIVVKWLESKQKALYVHGLPSVGKKTFVENVLTDRCSLQLMDCLDKRIKRSFSSVNSWMGLRKIVEQGKGCSDRIFVFDHADECPELIERTKVLLSEGIRLVLIFDYYDKTLKSCRFFPLGYVDELEIGPLDFSEYCWANGVRQQDIVRYVEKVLSGQELEKMIFQRFQELWDRYLFTGGYPACVEANQSGEWAKLELELIKARQSSIAYVGACFGKKARSVYASIGEARSGFFDRFVPSRVSRGGTMNAYREAIDVLSTKKLAVAIPYFMEGNATADVSLNYVDPGLMRVSLGIENEEGITSHQYHLLEMGAVARALDRCGYSLWKEHSYSYSPDLICKRGSVEFALEIKASRGARLRVDKALSYPKGRGLYVLSPNPAVSFRQGMTILPTCMFALMAEGDLL